MNALDQILERTILICARRDTVFRFFTDSERWATWWGAGSRIEARPGGAVHIRLPDGTVASGQVVEVVPNQSIVFTYGYEGAGKPVPPGGSRVTLTLETQPQGTLLHLRHELADESARNEHVQGWRYQLAVFANVVAREQHAGVGALVDRFLAAWSEKDAARRREELVAIATEDIVFHDAYSSTRGIDDLAAHIGAAQVFMPGVVLERRGEIRQCQGTAIADWDARGPEGPRGRGSNVIDLSPDGRIARVVGLWG